METLRAAERLALRVVQAGAIAVVLVALPNAAFDLDRFLVPKELVLHLTAVLAGLLAFRAIRRTICGLIDLLLVVYLLLGVLSAAMATNRWLAIRALAVSASGIALLWTARGLKDAGLARPLLNALALAVVVASVTSLLQAYGLMDKEVVALLTEHGIQPSAHRVAVAQCVLTTHDHPSADRVWARVRDRFPMISRATVYNTLHLFVEKHLLRELHLAPDSVVFDANTERPITSSTMRRERSTTSPGTRSKCAISGASAISR